MMSKELSTALQRDFDIVIAEKATIEELQNLLSQHINYLIENDFDKLVWLLYKIDVSEQKLKLLLKEKSHEDAGLIIAQLIMEREQEKINSRKQTNPAKNNFDDEEKW